VTAIRTLAAFALVASGLAATAPRAQAHYENTYFPLHVGNDWTYTDGRGGVNEITATVDAWWASPTNGQLWFRLKGYNGSETWVRQTSTGRVYEWRTRPWYRLQARAGSQWTMRVGAQDAIPCSDDARVTVVSRSETVTVPAGTFNDCIHLSFRTHCFDAGLTDEWFARGVGLVKRVQQSFMGPRENNLKRATISGRSSGGSQVVATVRTSVATDQPEYWENHMPPIQPGRPGPEIKINCTVVPVSGQPVQVTFQDYNKWTCQVLGPRGNVVWTAPRIMAPAPAGGVTVTVPSRGETATFTVDVPFGTWDVGQYTVKVQFLAAGEPERTTTFQFDRAY
jgi:hypothetical protein